MNEKKNPAPITVTPVDLTVYPPVCADCANRRRHYMPASPGTTLGIEGQSTCLAFDRDTSTMPLRAFLQKWRHKGDSGFRKGLVPCPHKLRTRDADPWRGRWQRIDATGNVIAEGKL